MAYDGSFSVKRRKAWWADDDHPIRSFSLTLGAGRIVGIDSYLEQTETVKKMPWLKYLLG